MTFIVCILVSSDVEFESKCNMIVRIRCTPAKIKYFSDIASEVKVSKRGQDLNSLGYIKNFF